MNHGDLMFSKLILRGCLDLPSNFSTRKITGSSIRRVNTIVGVHVHIGVAIPHGFKHSRPVINDKLTEDEPLCNDVHSDGLCKP
jgi:hypothetical protein